MTEDDKKKLEENFINFSEKLKGDKLRCVRYEIGYIPLGIVIDERKNSHIIIKAFVPYIQKNHIGRVVVAFKDRSFEIMDIRVLERFREQGLASTLIMEMLSTIQKFNPDLITGYFKLLEEDREAATRLFKKFNFAVSNEPNNYISVFMDRPDQIESLKPTEWGGFLSGKNLT
jgi:ribosomal protein S18 acetylase RimI-like enzyme